MRAASWGRDGKSASADHNGASDDDPLTIKEDLSFIKYWIQCEKGLFDAFEWGNHSGLIWSLKSGEWSGLQLRFNYPQDIIIWFLLIWLNWISLDDDSWKSSANGQVFGLHQRLPSSDGVNQSCPLNPLDSTSALSTGLRATWESIFISISQTSQFPWTIQVTQKC